MKKTETEQMIDYAIANPLPGSLAHDESLLELAKIQQESFQQYMKPEFFEGHSDEAIKAFCKQMSATIKSFSFFLMDLESRNYKIENQY